MVLLPIAVCALYGLLTALVLIPFIQRLSIRWGAGEKKQFHHTHTVPISRFGGIAMAISFAVVTLVASYYFKFEPFKSPTTWIVLISCTAMFGVGLWDDFQPLGAKLKLLLQVGVALGVYFAGVQIDTIKNPFTNTEYHLGWLGCVLTVCYLVGITNLINLIDGIDGLAGGIGLMLMGLLAYVGFATHSFFLFMAVGFAGTLVGFLIYNFPPAKIYMGDGGAYLIGFMIGILSLVNSQKGTIAAGLIAPLFGLALPIIDVSLAIVRRGLKGLPIFRPDRKHLHHRLLSLGLSRRKAVLTLYALSLVFLGLAFIAFYSQGRMIPALLGVLFTIVIIAFSSFSFSREWFLLGKVVGNSLEARKETRYAMTLGKWLEMEAERAVSVESLWRDFQFVGEKLGLSRIRAVLPDGERVWESNLPLGTKQWTHHFELSSSPRISLDLDAPENFSEELFHHVADLAAESWIKSLQRWKTLTNLPIEFASVRTDGEFNTETRGPAYFAAAMTPPRQN